MTPKARKRKDGLQVDRVYVRWEQDRDGTNGDNPEGCTALAQVSYRYADGTRRLETFKSGGLYDIDANHDQEYKNEIANEEIEDLRRHLEHFGISFDDLDWNRLTALERK